MRIKDDNDEDVDDNENYLVIFSLFMWKDDVSDLNNDKTQIENIDHEGDFEYERIMKVNMIMLLMKMILNWDYFRIFTYLASLGAANEIGR